MNEINLEQARAAVNTALDKSREISVNMNIAVVDADSSSRQRAFFAMEYIQGQPLTAYIEESELGTGQRMELLAMVCDAVQHAHRKGVIHRDLKPGNILVDESGRPKILNFGVARATDADLQTVTLQTDVGQLVGTIP